MADDEPTPDVGRTAALIALRESVGDVLRQADMLALTEVGIALDDAWLRLDRLVVNAGGPATAYPSLAPDAWLQGKPTDQP